MELKNITDSPFSWAAVGCIIGLILGVTTLSVVLLSVGLGAFLLYLRLSGPAQHETEGKLFIIGPFRSKIAIILLDSLFPSTKSKFSFSSGNI